MADFNPIRGASGMTQPPVSVNNTPAGQVIIVLPPPPPPPPIFTLPVAGDTFRGGSIVTMVTADLVGQDRTRDDALTARTLPTGWVTIGDAPTPQVNKGVVTRAGVAGVSGLTAPDTDYVSFDIAIDVDILNPPDSPSAPIEIACLEHTITSSGDVARVCIKRGVGQTTTAAVAAGEMTIGGTLDPTGGLVLVPDDRARLTLRLVRNANRVYGYLGTRGLGGADDYTTLTKVLDHNIVDATGVGTVQFVSRNLTTGTPVAARWSNYTVRAHASINGRLLDNKLHRRDGQVIGNVPAATIQEVGSVPISIFGLQGSNTDDAGFLYGLPAPFTAATEVTRTLRLYNDPFVKDN